ncbi:MAG: hypothetical protein N2578_00335 [Bdellovibrionaceae bacterium]|nr:hypothetical protein [Pseudobdellovibrionaceae bacterium]
MKNAPHVRRAPATDQVSVLDEQAVRSADRRDQETQEAKQVPQVRTERMRVSFSPGFRSLSARSNYSLRDYDTAFHDIELGARVWAGESWGFFGAMGISLGATLPSATASHSRVLTRFEDLSFGVLRRIGALEQNKTKTNMFLKYIETHNGVSVSDHSRPRLSSAGISIGFVYESEPIDGSWWVTTTEFSPKIDHTERPNGTSNTRSGEGVESVKIGVALERYFKTRDLDAIRFSVDMGVERNSFRGQTPSPDPVTGVSPINVQVTTTSLGIRFGYSWGR